jgi:hypothetical protein
MGNTHRQAKKALTPLQKGAAAGGSRQSVNNLLPEFPLKRVDSDILPPEADLGLSNISLTQEEMITRSRGSTSHNLSGMSIAKNQNSSSHHESGDTPYSPMRNPMSDHDDNDSANNVSSSPLPLSFLLFSLGLSLTYSLVLFLPTPCLPFPVSSLPSPPLVIPPNLFLPTS